MFAATAHGQFTGACCFPVSQTCTILSPYDCVKQGGDFLGLETTCPTTNACDRLQHFGIGLSQVAARRLIREGVVHTLHVGNSLPVYQADHPIWDLLNYGVIIAPEINVNVIQAGFEDPEMTRSESAHFIAAEVLAKAAQAMSVFNTAHPGKLFFWTMHVSGLGAGWTWQVAEDSQLPIFTHHKDDIVADKLALREYISLPGIVGTIHNASEFTAASPWGLLGQFSEDYFREPWPAMVTITDHDELGVQIGEARSAAITEFDRDYRRFTLASAIVTPETGTHQSKFSISRTDQNHNGLLPCWFFKHGAAEMEDWIIEFCSYMSSHYNWPEGLPPPSAVIISDEDIGEASIDWANYTDYLYDSEGRASNSEYTIDGEYTLAQWHLAFAPDGFREEPENFEPVGAPYSPANAEVRSYLLATMHTAYNYHREMSTWRHIRAMFPRARLSQYQLGNGYGVSESIVTEVPIGPGETSSHGQRTWHGPVSWDEYNCGLTSAVSIWDPLGDGQVVPIAYNAAWQSDETAGAGSALDQVPMPNFSNTFSPNFFLNEGHPLFMEFLEGDNSGTLYEITDWQNGVFTVSPNLAVLSQVEDVVLYYPYDPVYLEWSLEPPNTVRWPLIETFCDRYGEPITAAGFKSTAMKWAAECARAQTRALPDNPYSVYYSMGQINGNYDGIDESVSFLATYPHPPFTCEDGWMSGADWGEIAGQAMDYGVNHFVWFMPDLLIGCADPEEDDCLTINALAAAISAVNVRYANNYIIYANIACIADWDMDGYVTEYDAAAFADHFQNSLPETDLNNNGLFESWDLDMFGLTMCMGGCAPISHPGCTQSSDCEVADWCGD
ncbi:MAG: hypothetical protein KF869_08850, partial [Phycisphaeraceae bacterium]|nr:hypothetical protein [Phycisphaeraceae bacterium]